MQLINATFLIASLVTAFVNKDRRRLIVNGERVLAEEYSFVVAILYCPSSFGGLRCARICSGSLIGEFTVLTAAHCLKYPAKETFALVGASNWISGYKDRSVPLVQATEVKRHPSYDSSGAPIYDVGLIFLDACLRDHPTIALPTSPSPSCSSVIALGYGVHQRIYPELYSSDGYLYGLTDVTHSASTCKAAYVDTNIFEVTNGLYDRVGLEASFSNGASLASAIESMFRPELHGCHGGDSAHATCNGDSGGPVFFPGSGGEPPVLWALTSFGTTKVCGFGPDFAALVAPLSSWIRARMQEKEPLCMLTLSSSARDAGSTISLSDGLPEEEEGGRGEVFFLEEEEFIRPALTPGESGVHPALERLRKEAEREGGSGKVSCKDRGKEEWGVRYHSLIQAAPVSALRFSASSLVPLEEEQEEEEEETSQEEIRSAGGAPNKDDPLVPASFKAPSFTTCSTFLPSVYSCPSQFRGVRGELEKGMEEAGNGFRPSSYLSACKVWSQCIGMSLSSCFLAHGSSLLSPSSTEGGEEVELKRCVDYEQYYRLQGTVEDNSQGFAEK